MILLISKGISDVRRIKEIYELLPKENELGKDQRLSTSCYSTASFLASRLCNIDIQKVKNKLGDIWTIFTYYQGEEENKRILSSFYKK